MRHEPLDPVTYAEAHAALHHARIRGLDLVEALHDAGLLMTPQRTKAIKVQAMRLVLESITSWRPVEILRRRFRANHPSTPADMYACMVDFIEEHMREAQK